MFCGFLLALLEMPLRMFGCKVRDCGCIKKCLRCIGHDEFDDFELTVLVHEAVYNSNDKKTTCVRVTAGPYTAHTEPSSKGIFQQPLNLYVEQGVQHVNVDLLENSKVLATLRIPVRQVLEHKYPPETMHNMKLKQRGIVNPRIKLTLATQAEADEEAPLIIPGVSQELDFALRQQLDKVPKEKEGAPGKKTNPEMEVLKLACAGPIELFTGVGSTTKAYLAATGPPVSRRWTLAYWNEKNDFENKKVAQKEIEMTKVVSIQPDPSRSDVLVIMYADRETRVTQKLTFRRVDRGRDVWVEMLQLIVKMAREAEQDHKKSKSSRGLSGERRAPSRER